MLRTENNAQPTIETRPAQPATVGHKVRHLGRTAALLAATGVVGVGAHNYHQAHQAREAVADLANAGEITTVHVDPGMGVNEIVGGVNDMEQLSGPMQRALTGFVKRQGMGENDTLVANQEVFVPVAAVKPDTVVQLAKPQQP